jgi:two-component system cell cycle sensor histidine kinase PleC
MVPNTDIARLFPALADPGEAAADGRGLPDDGLLAMAAAALADGVGMVATVQRADGTPADFEWLCVNATAARLLGQAHPVGRRIGRDGADGGCADLFALFVEAHGARGPVARVVDAPGGTRWRVSATALGGHPASAPDSRLAVAIADLGNGAAASPRPGGIEGGRARSEFLACMSRELRSPLGALLGVAELMRSEAFGPLGSARYRDYVQDIIDSGRHIQTLIDDILDLSRIESGTMGLQDEATDLVEMVEIASRLAAPQAVQAGVQLETDVAPDLPLLLADARAVRQMLVHLLANAIGSTPPDGRVVLTACMLPDGGIGIMIADTGTGMAEADVHRVLEPFGRAEAATVRPAAGGSGFGLPLVRGLMEWHGGRLELSSEDGMGTTAILLFPPERSLRHTVSPPLPARLARREG